MEILSPSDNSGPQNGQSRAQIPVDRIWNEAFMSPNFQLAGLSTKDAQVNDEILITMEF
jgi:hypothetical protein